MIPACREVAIIPTRSGTGIKSSQFTRNPLIPTTYGASMAPVREAWTDERLDDLNAQVGNMGRKMDEGFKRLDAKIDSRIDRLDAKIEGLDARIDSKIEGLRGEMDSKFDGMRAENRAEFASIHSEFAALNRLIIQVGGGVIATVIASMIVERL